MKKLMLASTVLLVVAAFRAPAAEALPLCFKWVDFCDGVEVDQSGPVLWGYWYHWDCAQNMAIYVSHPGSYANPCFPGKTGKRLFSSFAFPSPPDGPGDWYFVVDKLDGTLDMAMGRYNTGTCHIADLAYALQMGTCTGLKGENRSSIQ